MDVARRILPDYVGADTLMAFDYDGTLAPIAADRSQAVMRDSTRARLAQLARRRPTVIITGRARSDVLRFLQGVSVQEVIGNHGLEGMGTAAARFTRRVREWRLELETLARSHPGLEIEYKRYSLSAHFRHCPDKMSARDAALEAIERLDGARVVTGKYVLNVVPVEAPDKGQALLTAMARHNLRRAVFVGDDDTDEDIFALPPNVDVLRVRVGHSEDSAARYYLEDQLEVDRLLGDLCPALATAPVL